MPDILSERKAIWVYIKLDGDGFASGTEFDLRYVLEDAVTDRGIGKLQGAGSGGGWMDFSFEVENIDVVDSALRAVKELLAENKVPDELIRLEVVNQYDEICEDLPDFQPGDCLSYRFEDDDYGAAIILKRRSLDSLSTTQVGKPSADTPSDEILLGILDYKQQTPPEPMTFEQRHWLIGTNRANNGNPYLVWLHCFGGIEVKRVHRLSLRDNDPTECRFTLSWELVPEYFIRDKYRGNKALNPYEAKWDNRPNFQPGDCLSFRFEDGDFGAALVLKRSNEGLTRGETLVGILDYKQATPPHNAVFEQRKWLIDTQDWRKGHAYLVWTQILDKAQVELVHQITVTSDDPMKCQLSLFWEDIPTHVIREKSL